MIVCMCVCVCRMYNIKCTVSVFEGLPKHIIHTMFKLKIIFSSIWKVISLWKMYSFSRISLVIVKIRKWWQERQLFYSSVDFESLLYDWRNTSFKAAHKGYFRWRHSQNSRCDFKCVVILTYLTSWRFSAKYLLTYFHRINYWT